MTETVDAYLDDRPLAPFEVDGIWYHHPWGPGGTERTVHTIRPIAEVIQQAWAHEESHHHQCLRCEGHVAYTADQEFKIIRDNDPIWEDLEWDPESYF